jgi:hypothetical protein
MLTPRRSAVVSAVAQVRIRCVVAGLEDARAECPRVLSAASSMAHGIVHAPLRLLNNGDEIVLGTRLYPAGFSRMRGHTSPVGG